MLAGIKHRGPDDEGIQVDGNVGIGQVRLSILDLSAAGRQSFYSQDRRFSIVYNGEVYNYIELREELKNRGHTFNTATDTEVILAAYMKWGESFIDRLNGMFSMVIYDSQEKKVFAARDRFGIKPFLYTIDNNRFIFCSEMSPIIDQMNTSPTASQDVVYDYLTFNRVDQTTHTFFKEIDKLWHGHFIKMDTTTGEFSVKRWYNLRNTQATGFSSPASSPWVVTS